MRRILEYPDYPIVWSAAYASAEYDGSLTGPAERVVVHEMHQDALSEATVVSLRISRDDTRGS